MKVRQTPSRMKREISHPDGYRDGEQSTCLLLYHDIGYRLWGNVNQIPPRLNSKTPPSRVLADLVKKGKLGAKTGAGIYKYPPSELKRILGRRD